jgi:TPR repeat protein
MALSKAPPVPLAATVTLPPLQQESCNARARFVPGVGCETRRPAMADPALDEPTCEVGELDRCLVDCESGGAWSCSVLGKMYRDGIGVKRDARVAQKWQRRACALGGIDGCDGSGERPSKS